jgi:hypothetical protein
MKSSFIGKVEKAKRYAQEPQRITFSGFAAEFCGENSTHQVSYANGKWHCTCRFFAQWGTCSHIMALQQVMASMLPQEALASPEELKG